MLFTHARLVHLSSLANKQTRVEWAAMMNAAADRAANTFRRQMLALAEYRRPSRRAGGDSFTAIGQANIAAQQVIQNNAPGIHEKATNEQGLAENE